MVSDVEHLFIHFLDINISSLEKCLFRSLAHLKIVLVVFSYSYYVKQHGGSSKTKNRTTIWSSNSTLGYTYPEKRKTIIQKNTCTPMFTAALFTIANIWKQPKSPSRDNKEDAVYKYKRLLIIKKKICHLQQHGWTERTLCLVKQIRETNRNKYCMISLICRIWKIMNVNAKWKQTHRYRKQNSGY